MRANVDKMNPSCLVVYDALEEGSKNARSLREIQMMTGLEQRTIRKCVQILTSNGYAVANLENGNGYYLPNCVEDFKKSTELTNSRIRALTRKKHGLNKAFKRFVNGVKGIDPEVRKSIAQKN